MNDAITTYTRGLAFHRAGRAVEAERAYREAIAAAPQHADSHHMLGVLLGQAGQPARAIDSFRHAVALAPRAADYHHNLGEAYRQVGNFPAACAAFTDALALRADFLEASSNLALALKAEAALAASGGESAEVRALFVRAAEACNLKGNILLMRGQIPDAVAAYREAVAIDRSNASAWSNLGNVLRNTGLIVEAEEACRRAIGLDPGLAAAHTNLGNALYEQSRWDEATAAFEMALHLDPAQPSALHNVSSGSLLFTLYRSDTRPADILAAHRRWGDGVMARLAAPALSTGYRGSRDPDRPLRVGFVSPDLREHSVAYSFEPLLANLDRRQIVPVCYSQSTIADAVTARLKAMAAGWRETFALDDRALPEAVRADGIDILVDLAGHTLGGRLAAFACKPAPIAVTFQGYPSTSGLPAIDYRLTDAIVDPPEADDHHTEKLLRLPRCFLLYRPPADAPAVERSTEERALTFGSFNNLSKVTPEVIATWSAILRRLPEARLMLKAKPFADPGMRARIESAFAAHDVPSTQLDLRGPAPTTPAHLAMYGEVDIALDTFPYNGTTTTCEALWMGVPVVSLIGDRHAARVGIDLLTQIGQESLAAATTDDYVRLAVDLARDAAARRDLHGRLRELVARSALCDESGFARAMEIAFRGMWRTWLAGGRAD